MILINLIYEEASDLGCLISIPNLSILQKVKIILWEQVFSGADVQFF